MIALFVNVNLLEQRVVSFQITAMLLVYSLNAPGVWSWQHGFSVKGKDLSQVGPEANMTEALGIAKRRFVYQGLLVTASYRGVQWNADT